jgi:SAM-dependent methyltransferase
MDIMTLYFLHVLAKEWWSGNAPTTTNPSTPLTVLDFCCGSGTICRTVTEWSKTTPNRSVLVDGSDADSLACLAATKNMKKSNGNNGTIYQSDGFQSIELMKQWDVVLSNPPVHNLHGRSSFHVVEELMKGALVRLNDHGSLWLVTQNYIPVGCLCGPNLETGGWSACESFSDGRFTVWKLTKGVGNVGGKRKRGGGTVGVGDEVGESKTKKQKTGKKKEKKKKKKKKKKKRER